MTNAMPDDHRYVQYRQEQLVADDRWRPVIERLRSEPVPSIPEEMRNPEFDVILQRWRSFEPTTEYDLPSTHATFQPILEDIVAAASAIGLKPVAEIRLATSTDMAAGPISLPGTGGHLLFVGPGTSAFCNYWSKVIAWHCDSIARANRPGPDRSRLDTQDALRLDARPLALALKLALRYASDASVVGFGRVDIPEAANGIRGELLVGMETFVLAHEYGHFVAEERLPEMSGHDLEYFCDAVGLQLARNAPSQQSNWSNFVGAGAIAFFAAINFCMEVEALGCDRPVGASDSHPPLLGRIAAIAETVTQMTENDERAAVTAYVHDFVAIVGNFFEEGLVIAQEALRRSTD
jgi:hypothetical protein